MNHYWIQQTRADSFSPAVIFLGAPIQNYTSTKSHVETKQFISCVSIKKKKKAQIPENKTVNNRDGARVIGRCMRKQRERAENNREKGWGKKR